MTRSSGEEDDADLVCLYLIEMLKRSSVPSLTTIASLAALQSAAYG
jgi:hypothetical protein